VGIGCLEFPLSMLLINLRTESQRSAMAVSGFAQIVAYLSAAVAPGVMGALFNLSGTWTVVLTTLMIISVVVNVPAAVILRRNRSVDQELARH
ncbi:MAG: hypothetical protein RLZZ52_1023, partial [Actinomycetota bacterium]